MHRSVAFGLYGVVVAGLVGGTLTWATVDKSVTLHVDGETTSIHTLSGTVKGALADAGYHPTERDIVAPGLGSRIRDKSQIVLDRGRLLKLTVDGQERDVWVNAPTVSEALSDLGYATGAFSSVSRSKRLPLSPTAIDIRTPKSILVKHDGKTDRMLTTAASVQQVLADSKITLGTLDKISVPLTTRPSSGLTITIQRVKKGQISENQPIPFPTQQQQDASMTQGQTVVVTPGQNGTEKVTYAVVYVDGVITGKTVVSKTVTAQPIPQVQKVGTAAPPAATQAPAASTSSGGGGAVVPAGDAQAIAHDMVLARGWSEDDFSCLVSLWNKESGWRVDAANSSGAYGIPQALPGSKMSSAGADWQTNPATQITWGLGYIAGRYGTPCAAWSHSQANNWY